MISKSKNFMFISLAALALSILSTFFPIIYYTAGSGPDRAMRYSFNLIRLLDGRSFVELVQSEYSGGSLLGLQIDKGTSNILLGVVCVIGVAAIVLSFVGILSMTKQYESIWPFVFTLSGIICTAIPALAILIAVIMTENIFLGTMQVGVYVYITPAAMLASCFTVIKRHRLTREELRIQKAARAYIRPAGDLPTHQKGYIQ